MHGSCHCSRLASMARRVTTLTTHGLQRALGCINGSYSPMPPTKAASATAVAKSASLPPQLHSALSTRSRACKLRYPASVTARRGSRRPPPLRPPTVLRAPITAHRGLRRPPPLRPPTAPAAPRGLHGCTVPASPAALCRRTGWAPRRTPASPRPHRAASAAVQGTKLDECPRYTCKTCASATTELVRPMAMPNSVSALWQVSIKSI